jgi:hypothetical protein
MPAVLVAVDWIIYIRWTKAKAVIRGFSEFKTEKSEMLLV